MTEYITLKKMRNKANGMKIKERNKQNYRERLKSMVVPIPMDVFLEKIQGISHETVVRVLGLDRSECED